MRSRSSTSCLLAGVVLLVLGGCSAPSGSVGGRTVQVQADYPGYDTAGLVEEATLVVEGTALATEYTVVEPRYEGDDPEENPLAGLSEEEKQDALDGAAGVAATAVTFRVDVVHRGQAQPGQEVTVMQTGGVIDGVTYEVEGEVPLEVEQAYLLFARDGFDGAFTVLGGSAGTYIAAEDGVFTAVDPDVAPTQQLTSAEVAALTQPVP